MNTMILTSVAASDLGYELASSYRAHPNFQFAQQPLQLDGDLLDSFAAAYGFLSACAERMRTSEFERSAAECVAGLDRIFDPLRRQTNEPMESRFLEELHRECRRLLLEETDFFRWQRPRSLDFPQAAARSGAVQLQSQQHFFGAVSVDCAQTLRAIARDDLDRFRAAAASGKLRREDLSVNTGPTVRSIAQTLNAEFARQGVLDAVSAYIGRRMSVRGLALELSVPQSRWWSSSFEGLARAPSTLYAHVDESVVYPKAIVYLTDVDTSSGPTSCYPGAFQALHLNPLQALVGRTLANVGAAKDSPLCAYYARRYHQSMTSPSFRRHFMRLPESMRFNSHFGWDVLPDSAIERSLVARERVLTGRAGTYIVFDGARLLHRGGMPERDERVALQVVFTDASLTRRVIRRIRRSFS